MSRRTANRPLYWYKYTLNKENAVPKTFSFCQTVDSSLRTVIEMSRNKNFLMSSNATEGFEQVNSVMIPPGQSVA